MKRVVLLPIAALLAGTALMPMSAQAETVTRSKYTESGKGGYIYEANTTTCGWDSTAFDFAQSLYKSGYNRSTSNSGWLYSYQYNWCDGSYKNCYGYIDLNPLNLNESVRGTSAVQCDGSDSNGTWNSWTENVTIDAKLLCSSGYTTTSKYKNRESYSAPWGTATYTYSGSGTYCEGKASGKITSDGGINITLGQSGDSYGQISDWKNKTTTIETYTP